MSRPTISSVAFASSITVAAAAVACGVGLAGGCGNGSKSSGISCVADSVCHPECAFDPDCAQPGRDASMPDRAGGTGGAPVSGTGGAPMGGTGGAPMSGMGGGAPASGGAPGSGGLPGGSGGLPGSGGAQPGTGGTPGSGGMTGAGGCSGVTVSGQVTFTGVTTIAFDRVTTTVHHKRDIDQFEDGCLTSLDFTFNFGAGCTLSINADSSCLDEQGHLRITSVRLTADSQCPNFPDAMEGTYSASSADLLGSAITMTAARISDQNVASSCLADRFEIDLAGTLTNQSSLELITFGASTLVAQGNFTSTDGMSVCPVRCAGCGAGGAGGAGVTSAFPTCALGSACVLNACHTPAVFGPCTSQGQCPTTTKCDSTAVGRLCTPACGAITECPFSSSGTAVRYCSNSGATPGVCFLDCTAVGATCPTGMVCVMNGTTQRLCTWR